MAARTVSVKLLADVSGYTSGLNRASATTKSFTGELNKAARGGHLEEITRQTATLGLGLVGVAGAVVKLAADFDKQMSAVGAATHASASEMTALRAAAIAAGKDTQFSATEAAKGVTELAKAGVSTTAILSGGLKGSLDLAAAGQLSVAEAAETAASAMTQFRLSGDKVPHVADLLAAAAGKAQGSVHDMGAALNQSGLVAAQFGLSIEDTTGVLAEFAHAGLIGSDAGTSFKTMLLAMANPSKQTQAAMDDLGISFYDAQGQFIGISGVAQVLQTRLKGLTEEQRNATLGQIFGNDAIRSAAILYNDGAAGVNKWRDAVNDAGYANETAAKLTDNLAGDMERLKGSIETLAIESGSGANGGLRTLIQMAGGLIDKFSALPPVIGSTITVLAGLGGGALLLAAGWLKTRRLSADFRGELEKMGPAGERAAGGLSKVSSAATKAGTAFLVLETAGAVIGHFQDDLNPQLDALAIGLQRYAAGGELAGEASRVLGTDLKDLEVGFGFLADEDNSRRAAVKNMQQGLESLVPGLKGTNQSLATTKERVTAMDAALTQMVQGGQTDQANAAFQKLAAQLAVGGVSLEEFRKQFPQYAAALETAAGSTAGVTGATGSLTGALDRGADAQDKYATMADSAAGAARGEAAALSALATQLKAQTDPVFAFLDAQDSLSKAQREYSKALRENGKNSSEAKAALRDLTGASITLAGNAGTLAQTFDGKMDPALRTTLKSAHLTDAQIKSVAAQFRQAKSDGDKFAKDYKANTSAPGAKQAKTDLEKAYTAANHFAGPYVARLTIDGKRAVDAALADLLIKQRALATGLSYSSAKSAVQKDLDRNRQKSYHAGGWTGPGGKFEPAGVVHADEFVIRKEARQKIEARAPGVLEEMNATGQLPGYAGGGHAIRLPVTVERTRIPSWAEVASKVVAAVGSFGHWPSSPGAQRGDSGVWHKILALVKASGIHYQFGNAYRPGDPKWHGSGRAIDFMGYNQDRLAQFFLARQGQVLELIHRSNSRDYGITRGHYNAMPTQWPLHRNHLHVAMSGGGTINEPIFGVGASGRSYSFGENWMPERVTPGGQGAGAVTVVLENHGVIGSPTEVENWLTGAVDRLRARGRV